jgi:hypothetical protein
MIDPSARPTGEKLVDIPTSWELSMRTTTRIVLAGALIGAAVADGTVTASAQYYYPPPPYGYGYGGRTWNGCPPGYTVQGGNCAPYQGPVGGGWRTFNGCPPGYTVQGGNCAPYQGPVGGPPRRWYGY